MARPVSEQAQCRARPARTCTFPASSFTLILSTESAAPSPPLRPSRCWKMTPSLTICKSPKAIHQDTTQSLLRDRTFRLMPLSRAIVLLTWAAVRKTVMAMPSNQRLWQGSMFLGEYLKVRLPVLRSGKFQHPALVHHFTARVNSTKSFCSKDISSIRNTLVTSPQCSADRQLASFQHGPCPVRVNGPSAPGYNNQIANTTISALSLSATTHTAQTVLKSRNVETGIAGNRCVTGR